MALKVKLNPKPERARWVEPPLVLEKTRLPVRAP